MMTTACRRGRKACWIACAGLAVTLVVAALSYRPIVSRVVTQWALGDARALASRWPKGIPEGEPGAEFQAFVEKYRWIFLQGFFDRSYFASTFPLPGIGLESMPHWLVIAAYAQAREKQITGEEQGFSEFVAWLDPVLLRPSSPELLVELLTSDWTMVDDKDRSGGLPKSMLANILFKVDDEPYEEPWVTWEARCVAQVQDRHWNAILRDLDHPREKVRTGALLFLLFHPSPDLLSAKARKALADPSSWVRLAAAGVLALRGDASGAKVLAGEGLAHERWEVRWWAAYTLFLTETPEAVPLIEQAMAVEPDKWVKGEIDELLKAHRDGKPISELRRR